MFYKVVKRANGAAIVVMSEDRMATITPEVAEINDMRCLGVVGDDALYEFVSLQNRIEIQRANQVDG